MKHLQRYPTNANHYGLVWFRWVGWVDDVIPQCLEDLDLRSGYQVTKVVTDQGRVAVHAIGRTVEWADAVLSTEISPISQVDKIFGVFFPKIWEKVYMPQERRWKLLEGVKGITYLDQFHLQEFGRRFFFLMVKTNVKQASLNLIEDFELCILDVY